MADFTERQKRIIVDLIAIAWQAGAIRSEEQAAEIKGLKLVAEEKTELKKVE